MVPGSNNLKQVHLVAATQRSAQQEVWFTYLFSSELLQLSRTHERKQNKQTKQKTPKQNRKFVFFLIFDVANKLSQTMIESWKLPLL